MPGIAPVTDQRGNVLDDVQPVGDLAEQVDEKELRRVEAMIQSMTPEERRNPKVLNGRRRRRIARGSGVKVRDVNQLVSQFEEMKKMMKTMQKLTSQGRDVSMSNLMNKLTGGGGGRSGSVR